MVFACRSSYRDPESRLQAIGDGRLVLGLVSVQQDDGKHAYRMLLCLQAEHYTQAMLTDTRYCRSALLSKDGDEIVFLPNHLNHGTNMRTRGLLKGTAVVLPFVAVGILGGKWTLRALRLLRHRGTLGSEGLFSYARIHLKARTNLVSAWQEMAEKQRIYEQVASDRNFFYGRLGGLIESPRRRAIPLFRTSDFKVVDEASKKLTKASQTYFTAARQEREAQALLQQAQHVRKLELRNMSVEDLQQELHRANQDLDKMKIDYVYTDAKNRLKTMRVTVAEARNKIATHLNHNDNAKIVLDNKFNVGMVARSEEMVQTIQEMLVVRGVDLPQLDFVARRAQLDTQVQQLNRVDAQLLSQINALQRDMTRHRADLHNLQLQQRDTTTLHAEIEELANTLEALQVERRQHRIILQNNLHERQRLQLLTDRQNFLQQQAERLRNAYAKIAAVEKQHPRLQEEVRDAAAEVFRLNNLRVDASEAGKRLQAELAASTSGSAEQLELLAQWQRLQGDLRQQRQQARAKLEGLTEMRNEWQRNRAIVAREGSNMEELAQARQKLLVMEQERRVLPHLSRGAMAALAAPLLATAWQLLRVIDQSLWGYGERQVGRYWLPIFYKTGDFSDPQQVKTVKPLLTAVAGAFGYQVNPAAAALFE